MTVKNKVYIIVPFKFEPNEKPTAHSKNQVIPIKMAMEVTTVERTPSRNRLPGASIHDTDRSILRATKALAGQSDIHKQKLKAASVMNCDKSERQVGHRKYEMRTLIVRQNTANTRLFTGRVMGKSEFFSGSRFAGDKISRTFILSVCHQDIEKFITVHSSFAIGKFGHFFSPDWRDGI